MNNILLKIREFADNILDFFKIKKKDEERSFIYTKLYLLGNEAVCPICKGGVKMTVIPGLYKCNDCSTLYIFSQMGETDREIIVCYEDKDPL